METVLILWTVCFATLALAAWCDIRLRRIPAWLPVLPVVAASWPGVWPLPSGRWTVLTALGLMWGAVTVLALARVGLGDVALALPLALALGVWVVVALTVSLSGAAFTLAYRRRLDDPFAPHLLAGFLVASALRWGVGG